MKGIAIYIDIYLTVSMTFIYRQLKGLREFEPIVLAGHLDNMDVFPFEKIYSPSIGRKGETFFNRLYSKLYRTIRRTYVYTSERDVNYYGEIITKNKIRLIHSHFGPCGIKMIPVKQKCDVPLITTFHGFDVSKLLRNKTYLEDLKSLFKNGDYFIAVSESMREKMISLGCPETKVTTHYIGVPVEQFKYKEISTRGKNKKLRFLQVSNFIEKKGHKFTVSAFYELKKLYPNIELLLVGDGPLKAEIENLVNDLSLKPDVIFLGKKPQNEIPSLMHDSDIFVHHSVTGQNGGQEGIPTVIMEAMATGMPVISTYHSGIPELVLDGGTGFLTKENDVTALTAKMIELYKNSGLRKQFGIRGRKWIEEKFNMDIQNTKLEGIYAYVLGREGKTNAHWR